LREAEFITKKIINIFLPITVEHLSYLLQVIKNLNSRILLILPCVCLLPILLLLPLLLHALRLSRHSW